MANIIRRREREMAPAFPAWEPWRLMRNLLGWDPFREMERSLEPVSERAFVPSFDVSETKDAYLFRGDLPGIKEEDLDISLTGNRLTISGKREAEEKVEEENFYTYERSYGSFSRSFTLPEGVDLDNVSAELKDGVLHLMVPKKPEVQAKRIQLKAGGKEKEKIKA